MKILVVGSFHSPEKPGGEPNEDFFNSKNTTVFQSACEALGQPWLVKTIPLW